mmetsp:Transcript_13517/g.19942  ORF Transcript_13517/g.19942 Transcript_13517/m.19942 type:complete len:384 (+) Transcript_13517:68-1219(+)
MPSTGSNGGKKSVRFSNGEQNEEGTAEDQLRNRPKKRPRMERPNEDEEDDVDDWVNENEEDDTIPSARSLIDAKRSRRLQRQGQDVFSDDEFEENTKIDQSTSLQSENKGEGNSIPVEPFNMNEEQSDGTGYFDGDTYVFRRGDDEGEPDAWFDSLNEGERQEVTKLKRSSLSSELSNDNESMDDWSKTDLYDVILTLVSDSETILNALVRYGNLIKRSGKEETKTSEAALRRSQKSLNDLTSASNALLLKGDVDIYQKSRQDILKLVQSSAQSSKLEESNKPVGNFWEYMGNQDGNIHGPYSSKEMLDWTSAGYFVGDQAVQVRMASKSNNSMQPARKSIKEEMLSDLMGDDENNDESDMEKKIAEGEWISSDKIDFKLFLS